MFLLCLSYNTENGIEKEQNRSTRPWSVDLNALASNFTGQLWDETIQSCIEPLPDDDDCVSADEERELVDTAPGDDWIRCALTCDVPRSEWCGLIHTQTGELKLRKTTRKAPAEPANTNGIATAAAKLAMTKFMPYDGRRLSAAMCAAHVQARLGGPDPFHPADDRQVRRRTDHPPSRIGPARRTAPPR